MASRLRTWVRRVTPPTTRALAKRVAVELLDRVTHGAEQLAEALRPALPAAADSPPIVVTPAENGPTRRKAAKPKPKPLEGADLGWALARSVSTGFDQQTSAMFAEGLSAGAHDAEVVRRMRVGSRRLRSAVQLFGPWLGKKLHRRLERDLKAITGALGPLRDVDVVIAQFTDAANGEDPLRRAAAEHIRARLAEGHAQHRKRAAKAMRTVDRAALLEDLRQARLRIVDRLTNGQDVRADLAHLLDSVAADAFAKTPVPTTLEDREAVHEVRILAKRLRYAHGWVKPAFQHGPGPGRLLKRAQRAVGDSRDLDLLLERLTAHEAALRDEAQAVLADALSAWRESTERRRDKVDMKILPALADLTHATVTRLTNDGMGQR